MPRTITLAWVVLGDHILPLADLFLATSMIAKYTAPGLTKWLLARILVAGDSNAAAAQLPTASVTPAER
jgi:galactitol-specific phosphotransferase system IIC component